MSVKAEQRSESIANLLNSLYVSMKAIVPIAYQAEKPILVTSGVPIKYGVMIGITGDVKGQLVFDGDEGVFAAIGAKMYGMPLEGEMLHSFSGELGNMIVGRLSTTLAHKGVNTDITSPTIVYGETNLLGHQQALQVNLTFEETGEIKVYLLLNI